MVHHLARSARLAIVITGSGMCNAGRIVNYLKAMLDSEWYTIRARVETIGGYSAHADQQGLIDFVRGVKQEPADIRLAHGEKKAQDAQMEHLAK